jgi:DNA-directed RNA polymerase delta subunit
VTAKTILLRIILCLTIIGLWAWMSADEWEQEIVSERVEQERIESIQAYNKSKQSPALGEDDVDTTPIPVKEAEPTYISAPVKRAKKNVVQAKKRIKKSVKNHTR